MERTSPSLDSNKVIDDLGGTNAVADLFEIDPSAVSQWRRKGIPKPRLQFLKLAHPELFAGSELAEATTEGR